VLMALSPAFRVACHICHRPVAAGTTIGTHLLSKRLYPQVSGEGRLPAQKEEK
jgi:hypothetical protein